MESLSWESLPAVGPVSGDLSRVEPVYVVAYSGGVDSHVLLHCCKLLDIHVRAVHVHHGLQSVADYWVTHCQEICQEMEIALDILYVDASPQRGQSPEEAARSARYQALKDNMRAGECLLTAQHRDDQAETILLQLLRTASAAGLAAMPVSRVFGVGLHLRPLLDFSRSDIESFADEQQLHWIEDPSNNDIAFDRNYLRSTVMPLLKDRWPEVVPQMVTVAKLQSNNLRILDDMAAIDLANVSAVSRPGFQVFSYDILSMLSLDSLMQLTSARLLNLLRYWIGQTVGVPTRNLLSEIEKGLVHSQDDANPLIGFSGIQFRKYQGVLYLLRPKQVEADSHAKISDSNWLPSSTPLLNIAGLQLQVIQYEGGGIKPSLVDKEFTIRFRQGGERFHPSNRNHSQSLKKLLQEAGVPPWERDTIPLLYHGEELVAVIGYWIAKACCAGPGETGWNIDVVSS